MKIIKIAISLTILTCVLAAQSWKDRIRKTIPAANTQQVPATVPANTNSDKSATVPQASAVEVPKLATQSDPRRTNQEALKIADGYPDTCEVADTPLKGTELRYYPPFSPTDGVFEAWCKLQTLKSNQPIKVWLITQEHQTPLVKSDFPIDGAIHSTKKMFAYDLVDAIQHNGGVYLNRAIRRLSSVGFPPDSPEGAYQMYQGALQMDLGGVEIMGLAFTVTAYFDVNIGLIPKHFVGAADYMHIPIYQGPKVSPATNPAWRQRNGFTDEDTRPSSFLIGFPWSLSYVQLSSTDRRVPVAGPEIRKLLAQKYTKWIVKNDVADPQIGDQEHRATRIDDGFLEINFHSGNRDDRDGQEMRRAEINKGGNRQDGRYVELNYMPSPKGPYNPRATAKTDFETFKASAIEKNRQTVVNGMKQAEKKNLNPF